MDIKTVLKSKLMLSSIVDYEEAFDIFLLITLP